VVVCAPCGFGLPESSRLAGELAAAGVLPVGVPVWAVDANASFARPGPRLVEGVAALAAILHPSVCGPPDPAYARQVA
jgi:iron complex transport system substrate-binding protein